MTMQVDMCGQYRIYVHVSKGNAAQARGEAGPGGSPMGTALRQFTMSADQPATSTGWTWMLSLAANSLPSSSWPARHTTASCRCKQTVMFTKEQPCSRDQGAGKLYVMQAMPTGPLALRPCSDCADLACQR